VLKNNLPIEAYLKYRRAYVVSSMGKYGLRIVTLHFVNNNWWRFEWSKQTRGAHCTYSTIGRWCYTHPTVCPTIAVCMAIRRGPHRFFTPMLHFTLYMISRMILLHRRSVRRLGTNWNATWSPIIFTATSNNISGIRTCLVSRHFRFFWSRNFV